MPLEIASRTDRGLNDQREENEDSCGFVTLSTSDGRRVTLAAVADGMGGSGEGRAASTAAIDWLMRERTLPNFAAKETLAKWLHDEVRATHHHVQKAISSPRAGTTCTAIAVHRGIMCIGHVGNGRMYLHSPDRFVQLTTDHTLDAALEATGLGRQEQRSHSALLRSLGGPGDLPESYVDTLYESGPFSGSLTVTLRGGETVVLCTDGLWSVVDDNAISRVIQTARSADVIAERLVALARGNGAPDNTSIVVIRDTDEPPATPRVWKTPPPAAQTAPSPTAEASQSAAKPSVPNSLAGTPHTVHTGSDTARTRREAAVAIAIGLVTAAASYAAFSALGIF